MQHSDGNSTNADSPPRGSGNASRLAAVVLALGAIAASMWSIAKFDWQAEPDRPVSGASAQEPQHAPPFDLGNAIIDRRQIHSGGPPKDGIPALTKPRFVSAEDADYLAPEDRVIGVARGDDIRAYPLAILNYHEVVNDTVDGTPLAVTYCPLCDSATVFDRRTSLGEREFGVSGLLFNSNVLMYDRSGESDSLWSQGMARGVTGPGANEQLTMLPLELTTWAVWSGRHPRTRVLSNNTGHRRDYRRSPYSAYFENQGLMFPAEPSSDEMAAKTRVLGVWTDTVARAYAEPVLRGDQRHIVDMLDGERLVIEYNPNGPSLRVVEAGPSVRWMYAFWFAWYAFHPDTSVFAPPNAPSITPDQDP